MVSTLAGVCGSTGQRDGTGQSALFSDSIQSITCLANCSVLVADVANGRLRWVVVQPGRQAQTLGARARDARHGTGGLALPPTVRPPTNHHDECRAVILHDPDCLAAAQKVLARRYTAASLWAVGLVVALVTAVVAAVAIHKRQLTAAGFVVWSRHFGEGGQAAGDEYARLVNAAEVPSTPATPEEAAQQQAPAS